MTIEVPPEIIAQIREARKTHIVSDLMKMFGYSRDKVERLCRGVDGPNGRTARKIWPMQQGQYQEYIHNEHPVSKSTECSL